MASIAMFFKHTVSVETYAGEGAFGASYAEPDTVRCFADDGVRLVRDKTGREVVSSTTIYAPSSTTDMFAVESRVTVNGRVAYVISANAHPSAGLGLPDHVEVHLT